MARVDILAATAKAPILCLASKAGCSIAYFQGVANLQGSEVIAARRHWRDFEQHVLQGHVLRSDKGEKLRCRCPEWLAWTALRPDWDISFASRSERALSGCAAPGSHQRGGQGAPPLMPAHRGSSLMRIFATQTACKPLLTRTACLAAIRRKAWGRGSTGHSLARPSASCSFHLIASAAATRQSEGHS